MRATYAEINLTLLRNNLLVVKNVVGDRAILAMVKANAYGHGIVECSRELESNGVEFLGVAFACEGELLRQAGIKSEIVVMAPPANSESYLLVDYDLQSVVDSIDLAVHLSQIAVQNSKRIKLHVYIDTGMRRDGVSPESAVSFVRSLSILPALDLVGICTHFASSDDNDSSFTQCQLFEFEKVVDELRVAGFVFEYVHSANSGAILSTPGSHFNLVRPGLTLFGYVANPAVSAETRVEPILSLHTEIVSIRKIGVGDSVSYGRRFIANKPTTIATIPIGYGDGFFRSLTGKAECLIQGTSFPIVGTICMDECMVDIGNNKFDRGEKVVLLGKQSGALGSGEVTAREIAEKIDSIPYEVTSAISARVERRYV